MKDEVRYKDIVFKKGFITDMSAYMGWPNDEKDTLWTDLYKCKSLRDKNIFFHHVFNQELSSRYAYPNYEGRGQDVTQ